MATFLHAHDHENVRRARLSKGDDQGREDGERVLRMRVGTDKYDVAGGGDRGEQSMWYSGKVNKEV